jgi:hypothetical protein
MGGTQLVVIKMCALQQPGQTAASQGNCMALFNSVGTNTTMQLQTPPCNCKHHHVTANTSNYLAWLAARGFVATGAGCKTKSRLCEI